MAAVGPQVHGDAMGAGALGQEGGGDGLGLVHAASLADGRHMIDIDTKADRHVILRRGNCGGNVVAPAYQN
jgi:hypothetical protein